MPVSEISRISILSDLFYSNNINGQLRFKMPLSSIHRLSPRPLLDPNTVKMPLVHSEDLCACSVGRLLFLPW